MKLCFSSFFSNGWQGENIWKSTVDGRNPAPNKWHNGTIFWSTGERFLPYIQYLSYQSKRNPNPQVIACLSFGKLRVCVPTDTGSHSMAFPSYKPICLEWQIHHVAGFALQLFTALKKTYLKALKKNPRQKPLKKLKNVPSFHLWISYCSHGAKRRKEPSESSSGYGSP